MAQEAAVPRPVNPHLYYTVPRNSNLTLSFYSKPPAFSYATYIPEGWYIPLNLQYGWIPPLSFSLDACLFARLLYPPRRAPSLAYHYFPCGVQYRTGLYAFQDISQASKYFPTIIFGRPPEKHLHRLKGALQKRVIIRNLYQKNLYSAPSSKKLPVFRGRSFHATSL